MQIKIPTIFSKANADNEKEQKFKIILEYTEEDYNKVTKHLKNFKEVREQIILSSEL